MKFYKVGFFAIKVMVKIPEIRENFNTPTRFLHPPYILKSLRVFNLRIHDAYNRSRQLFQQSWNSRTRGYRRRRRRGRDCKSSNPWIEAVKECPGRVSCIQRLISRKFSTRYIFFLHQRYRVTAASSRIFLYPKYFIVASSLEIVRETIYQR